MKQFKLEQEYLASSNFSLVSQFIDNCFDLEDLVEDLVVVEELDKDTALKVVACIFSYTGNDMTAGYLVESLVKVLDDGSLNLSAMPNFDSYAVWATQIIDLMIQHKVIESRPSIYSTFITSLIELPDDVAESLQKRGVLYPSIVKPRPLTESNKSRYLNKSINRGIYTNPRYNDLANDKVLDVLNIQGSIELCIDHSALEIAHEVVHTDQESEQAFNDHTLNVLECIDHITAEGNSFYCYPVYDSRLRLYTGNHILNYQGDDYYKSLIDFKDKELVTLPTFTNVARSAKGGFVAKVKGKIVYRNADPELCHLYLLSKGKPSKAKSLGSLYWVKVSIANCIGKDKLTLIERVMFVNCNLHDLELLESMAVEDDHKYSYLKAMRQYNDALAGVPTGSVVHLDSTMSVAQIGACLSGHKTDAINSNLTANPDRLDPYMLIFKIMEQSKHFKIEDKVSRQMIKVAIMPGFYGSVNAPSEVFYHEDDDQLELNLKVLAKTNRKILPGTCDVIDILTEVMNTDATLTKQSWTLPDGGIAMSLPQTKYIVKEGKEEGDYNHHQVNLVIDGFAFTHHKRTARACGIELLAK